MSKTLMKLLKSRARGREGGRFVSLQRLRKGCLDKPTLRSSDVGN
ncbi:MAG: hypothetical protein ACPLY9_07320 [Nitrososphaerales archaeon]